MELKKLKKYSYGVDGVHMESLCNLRGFREWTDGLSFEERSILYRDNRAAMLERLGKRTCSWRGEFFFHIWAFSYGECTVVFLTAAEKGTCLEISGDVDEAEMTAAAIAAGKFLIARLAGTPRRN